MNAVAYPVADVFSTPMRVDVRREQSISGLLRPREPQESTCNRIGTFVQQGLESARAQHRVATSSLARLDHRAIVFFVVDIEVPNVAVATREGQVGSEFKYERPAGPEIYLSYIHVPIATAFAKAAGSIRIPVRRSGNVNRSSSPETPLQLSRTLTALVRFQWCLKQARCHSGCGVEQKK